ncbi:TrmH family RNA methyltransferase [Glutamicibacter protophormiae]|uniref:TrmH family RNA methyltransferase n=1 Tax=Glutamicibacter protophormiae TaxID=37930 RepID=UPI003A9232EC
MPEYPEEILNPERILHVADLHDARLDEYLRLSEAHLRMRTDVENGLYIAESTKVVQRAINAGHTPRSFLLAEKHLGQLVAEFNRFPDAPIFIGDDAQLQDLVGFHLHRGAMAAMNRPAPRDLDEVLAASSRVAILEDIADHTNVRCSKISGVPEALAEPKRSRIAVFENIQDHTNLGAAFRSAAAIGVDAVLITPQCVDPLYRRAVRVSMGTVFQVPWARVETWPESIEQLQDAGYIVVGMTLAEGSITLDELVAEDHQKLALVFGNEGRGLSAETEAMVDRCVTIPMMGGVDSLNVATSAAVALYATR